MSTRQRQQPHPAEREFELGSCLVLSFLEWCFLNNFSPATGRRILKSGRGPVVTRLSERRIGITVANNVNWQAARSTRPP
jgi:hypothetical protein